MVVECENSENKDVKTKAVRGAVDTKDNEDYLVVCIGAFGAWQARVCILACLARFMVTWNLMLIIFLTYDTEFICTSFNTTVPDNVTGCTCYDECTKYEFAEGLFTTSFVAEFELICERAWMANMVQSVLMFGFLCGVSLFGWISDGYGRRKAFMLSSLINVILMVVSPFSPNYWVFVVLRFFIGVASGGVLVVGIVVILEVVGPQHRDIAGSCANMPDGIAEALLCAFVYFSPTWRVYLLSLGIVSIFILATMALLPESPRWLMTTGRLDEMRKLMVYAAKCNSINAATAEENINKGIIGTPSTESKAITHYWDLFRTKKMALKTSAVTFIGLVACLSYFGINQYVSFLGSNVYISVIALGLMQVPACFMGMLLNKMLGRKISTIGTLSMTGLAMFLLTFVPPDHWSATVLGVAGLSAIAMTFNVIYVYTTELFPTEIRNMAFGISSAGGKVGGIVAPFIATLSPHWIASIVFAAMLIMAACICFVLPETKGQKLQDHIDKGECTVNQVAS